MDLYEIMYLLTKLKEMTDSAFLAFQNFEAQFIANQQDDFLYPIHIGMLILNSQQNDLMKLINALDRCILELRKQGYLKEETESDN